MSSQSKSTNYPRLLDYIRQPESQPYPWREKRKEKQSEKTSANELKLIAATMLRTLHRNLPDDGVKSVRLHFDLYPSDMSRGYSELLQRLDQQRLTEDTSPFFKVLDRDSRSFAARQAHQLANEAELEGRLMGLYAELFPIVCEAAGLRGHIILASQEEYWYTAYDGQKHIARSDLAGKLIKEMDTDGKQSGGSSPEPARNAETQGQAGGGMGAAAELKALFALTHSDLAALDELEEKESIIAFVPSRNRNKPNTFAVSVCREGEKFTEVPTQLANALFKTLEPSAYAWIRGERTGVLTNGPRSLITQNGKYHAEAATVVRASRSFGVDAAGQPLPVYGKPRRLARDPDEPSAVHPLENNAIVDGVNIFDELDAISSKCDGVPVTGPDGQAFPGTHPGDVFSILVAQAVLSEDEPEATHLPSSWPRPGQPVPKTPPREKPYRTR